MNSAFDPQFQQNDSTDFARNTLRGVPAVAHAGVVNRTHRVVRERAKVMQQRRSRERSLMVPLIICFRAAHSQRPGRLDRTLPVSGRRSRRSRSRPTSPRFATTDNNHFLVILLWFVPVSVAVLTTVWVRRSRNNADDEAR